MFHLQYTKPIPWESINWKNIHKDNDVIAQIRAFMFMTLKHVQWLSAESSKIQEIDLTVHLQS